MDCGVVTPNAMLVPLDKMRVLRGLEKLWMQGIYHTGRRQQVVEQLAVTDDTLLGDTGGNAFAMKSFGAAMFTLHHMRAVLQHFLVTGKLVVPRDCRRCSGLLCGIYSRTWAWLRPWRVQQALVLPALRHRPIMPLHARSGCAVSWTATRTRSELRLWLDLNW